MQMRRVVLAAVAALLFVPAAHAWSWPSGGPVLRPFVLGADPYASGQHRGVDVGGDLGAEVHAPAAGAVAFTGTVPGSGKTVTLQTADGYAVTLLQLGDILVAKGDAVDEGAVVGRIGPSSDSVTTAPHVHLGIRLAADPTGYVDPLTLLPAREAPSVPEPEPSPAPAAEPAVAAGGAEPAPVPAPAEASGPQEPPAPASEPVPPAADQQVDVPPRAQSGAATASAPVVFAAHDTDGVGRSLGSASLRHHRVDEVARPAAFRHATPEVDARPVAETPEAAVSVHYAREPILPTAVTARAVGPATRPPDDASPTAAAVSGLG